MKVIGLGKSGVAAARLALARGASVLAIDQNEYLDPLEVYSMMPHSTVCRGRAINFTKGGQL